MTHYSLAQKPVELSKWAKAIAQDIKNISGYPVLVYTGMSGISAATAISLSLAELGIAHGMMYVRKDHEDSHGNKVERQNIDIEKPCTFIFVDDFIASGQTMVRCFNIITNFFAGCNYPQFTAFNAMALQGRYEDESFQVLIKTKKQLNRDFPIWSTRVIARVLEFPKKSVRELLKEKAKSCTSNLKIDIPFWANDWRRV